MRAERDPPSHCTPQTSLSSKPAPLRVLGDLIALARKMLLRPGILHPPNNHSSLANRVCPGRSRPGEDSSSARVLALSMKSVAPVSSEADVLRRSEGAVSQASFSRRLPGAVGPPSSLEGPLRPRPIHHPPEEQAAASRENLYSVPYGCGSTRTRSGAWRGRMRGGAAPKEPPGPPSSLFGRAVTIPDRPSDLPCAVGLASENVDVLCGNLPSFAAITRRDVNRMRAPDVG